MNWNKIWSDLKVHLNYNWQYYLLWVIVIYYLIENEQICKSETLALEHIKQQHAEYIKNGCKYCDRRFTNLVSKANSYDCFISKILH